jgi:hypothetical protein
LIKALSLFLSIRTFIQYIKEIEGGAEAAAAVAFE